MLRRFTAQLLLSQVPCLKIASVTVSTQQSLTTVSADPAKGSAGMIPWGIIMATLSGVSVSLGSVAAKPLKKIMSAEIMAISRYFGTIVVAFSLLLECGEAWFVAPGPDAWRTRFLLFLRGTFAGTSIWFRYVSLHHIHVANYTILSLTTPIFSFVIGYFLLKEAFGRWHVLVLVLATVGIVLATDVISMFHKDATKATNITTSTAAPGVGDEMRKFLIGNGAALASALVLAFSYIVVRMMKKLHSSVIVFNFCMVAMIEMTLLATVTRDFRVALDGYMPYLLLSVTLTAFTSQLLNTKANKIEEAGIVSVCRAASQTVCAFVWDVIFFGIHPNALVIIGAILVIASVTLLTFRQYVLNLPPDAPLRKRFSWLE